MSIIKSFITLRKVTINNTMTKTDFIRLRCLEVKLKVYELEEQLIFYNNNKNNNNMTTFMRHIELSDVFSDTV